MLYKKKVRIRRLCCLSYFCDDINDHNSIIDNLFDLN